MFNIPRVPQHDQGLSGLCDMISVLRVPATAFPRSPRLISTASCFAVYANSVRSPKCLFKQCLKIYQFNPEKQRQKVRFYDSDSKQDQTQSLKGISSVLLHGQTETETHPVKSMYSTSEIDNKLFLLKPSKREDNPSLILII